VKVDPQNEVAESNEQNNQAQRAVVLPDAQVAYAYATNNDAQTILLTAVISNTGGINASDVGVQFRQGTVTGTLLHNGTIAVLPAGEARTVTAQWNRTATTTGTETVWVLADPANTIVEGEEENNEGVLWVDILPDLTVKPADIEGSGPYQITIHNQGVVTATNVAVTVRRDSLGGALVYSGMVSVIVPQGQATLSMGLGSGGYNVYVEVDPGNVIPEADESNNVAAALLVGNDQHTIYLPLITRSSGSASPSHSNDLFLPLMTR